jgi:hypothetical protein
MAVVPSDPTHPHYGATLARWPPGRVAAASSEKIREKSNRCRLTSRLLTATDGAHSSPYRSFCGTAQRRTVVAVPAVIGRETLRQNVWPLNLAPRSGVLLIATIPDDPLFHGGKRSAIALSASSTDKAR